MSHGIDNRYEDEYQNIHIRDKILGSGGQGAVFRTKDPDLAIKLIMRDGTPITDEMSIKKYSELFKRVRLLPLPENLHVSVPIVVLQNHAGYVMQLLSHMVPLSHFLLDGISSKKINSSDIPAWLSEMKEEDAKKIVHYYGTGSLRRRLNVLYKCSSLLARLHGNGMVYGDISPNNIYVSESLDDNEVWLIDADNLRIETTSCGNTFFTPMYGAPEMVLGQDGGRPSCDCHAFAVVAFYILSLIHPFLGKKVNGEDDNDWADDENDNKSAEEKAYAGLFPWVDDQNDDSNSSDSGLPRSLILTEQLIRLFENTFGPGRTSPFRRPTIYHWPKSLAQAADMTVRCPECSMSYYYYNDFIDSHTNKHVCPYCQTQRPRVLIFESYRWTDPKTKINSPCWRYIREVTQNTEVTIPRRVIDEFTIADSDETEFLISLNDNSILIKKSDHSEAELYIDANCPRSDFRRIFSQMRIDYSTTDVQFWMFANLNSPRLIKCMICGETKCD